MLLRQSLKLHPSTIHEIALLIYGGVYTPVRKPRDIERFFKMAGVDYYCNIGAYQGSWNSPEITGKIVDLLGRFNTGSKNGETGFPQLSPELESVIKYLVDPREYDRDLGVVNHINDKLNDVLKFEKISVILDESNGYSPKIMPYHPVDLTDNKIAIKPVNDRKIAADLKKHESRFNIKYTFYSIFGMIIVVLIVLVITNFSKAVFSGTDVILLFALVSVVVLPLFGFGLDIFTKGEYRKFLENIFNIARQIKR